MCSEVLQCGTQLAVHEVMNKILGLVVLTACNGTLAGGGASPDASPGPGPGPGIDAREVDAAPSGPSSVTVSGHVGAFGANEGVPGVNIAAYSASGDAIGSPVAALPNGTFTISVPTTAGAFNGYFLVTSVNPVPTYVWPAAPLTTDLTELEIGMFGTAVDIQHTLFQECGSTTYSAADSVIGVQVGTLADTLVTGMSGAKVDLPDGAGSVCYNKKFPAGDEVPDSGPTATDTSGGAYILNVPASDSVTLAASGGSATLTPTKIPTVAGAYTMTFIVP